MNTSGTPFSRIPVAKKNFVLFVLLAMLLITLGVEVATVFLNLQGVLSLAWPMAMLLLAMYWLRLSLSDWARRIQFGQTCDDTSARVCDVCGEG